MQNNEAKELELELELPEGEVDIHAADVDTSLPDTIQQEETVAETSTGKELDEISDSVQKRIDKLTYKMREAERQRDEAVNYAQSVNHTATSLKEKLKNSDTPFSKSMIIEYNQRLKEQKLF